MVLVLAVVRAAGSGAAGEKGAANGAEAGKRPGQKSGKVVFGSTGNRLLDKKLAADKPKPAPKPEVSLDHIAFLAVSAPVRI